MSIDATAILSADKHRPWALPAGEWVLRQSWRDLLFVHWPVPATRVRRFVPADLEVDELDGATWVGIVPFAIEHLSWRFMPDLPYFSAFPELNLRVYVIKDGKPGVWFISLDADNAAAVAGARALFALPYYRASIAMTRRRHEVEFESVRRRQRDVALAVRYRAEGEAAEPRPGTLEHFLTERYCLYSMHRDGRLHRLEIHHPPWRLRRAVATIELNTLAAGQGFLIDSAEPPLLHFSERQDVLAWWPEHV
jgi:uncharacterized protein YqjF (DUF2071 family)